MKSDKAMKTATRYFGQKAKEYRAMREGQSKWKAEDDALRDVMKNLPEGSKVLDIPCGDGRFFSFYHEKKFEFWGEDISKDMLAEAIKAQPNGRACCHLGDIFDIDHADDVFDATVTMRFMNLIKPEDVPVVLEELQRVSRNLVIFGWREGDPDTSHYHDPHPISLIEDSLLDGWFIKVNKPMHQEDYRIIVLGCK